MYICGYVHFISIRWYLCGGGAHTAASKIQQQNARTVMLWFDRVPRVCLTRRPQPMLFAPTLITLEYLGSGAHCD